MLRRYVPPRVPRPVIPAVAIGWALLTITRGLDYVTGNQPGAQSEIVMRALTDIEVWGAALVAGGVLLIAAYACRVHLLVWLAHLLLAAIYACCAITIAQAARLAGDGWSALSWSLGGFTWHLLVLCLTKPLPPRQPAAQAPAPGRAS